MGKVTFRNIVYKQDKLSVKEILEKTSFFSEDEVDMALSLFDEYFEKGEKSGYNFIFILVDDKVVGYTCYGHIEATVSSYDLYWIAIDPKVQNLGLGHKLLEETEQVAVSRGAKNLYVETSSTEKYNPTRQFYQHNGFFLEAVLKGYYREDDDKCIYVKTLTKD
ncbi:MAG: GNAT family N-acetyltransferase [Sphaerochaetaceae bacterium]